MLGQALHNLLMFCLQEKLLINIIAPSGKYGNSAALY